jgi:zinc protease
MIISRTYAPKLRAIEHIEIPKPLKILLDNQLPVYIINAGSEDIIRIELIFPAGNYYQQEPLTATTVNTMLQEGTKNMTASQIAEQLDYYGAFLQLTTEQDNASASLLTLKKYLKDTITVLYETIMQPMFPEAELSILLNKKRQQFIVNCNKVQFLARMEFNQRLFGADHPYGRSVCKEDFTRVSRQSLIDFYNQYYNLAGAKIILSGKVNQKDIELVNQYFGQVALDAPSLVSSAYLPSKDNPGLYTISRKEPLQSALRIGKVLFNKTHEDYFGMEILNTIIGGYFGSRLMKNIREVKGYTYGINSFLVSLKHTGFWAIVTEVGADVTQKAIDEIHKEIELIQRQPVSAEELSLVKNYMLGEALRMFDGPFALAESFKAILDYNLSFDFYDQMIAKVRSIGSDELQALAQKHLQPGTFTEIIAGKA